jgi:hypothetical protein
MIMQLGDFTTDLLHYLADLSIYTHAVSRNRCRGLVQDRPARSTVLWHDDIVQPRAVDRPGSVS